MTKIDLKSHPFLRKIFGKTLWGYTDVCRTISFQADYGFYAAANLSPVRVQIPGRLQSKDILMLRSVSMYGLRPDYPPGKSARYRDLPAISKQKAVPYGHSGKSFKVNSCRGQRKSRLAHICRIRPNPYRHSQRVIQRRFVSRRTERNSICSGCNHYRSMPLSVPLGTISKEQSRCQAPYTIGPKGQHSHIYSHYRRQVERCQRSRSVAAGSRCILRNGSRLSGLQKALYFQPSPCIFCYPSQKEHAIQETLFTYRRQGNRASMRSNNLTYRFLSEQALSRYTAPSEVPGCKFRKDTRVSHQQFHFATINDCTTISQPLASGTFFQMDQAAPQNKAILWYFRECRQDSGLDLSLIHI